MLRDKYPKVWIDYSTHADARGLHLGDIVWSINDPHVVLNAITQEDYGREPHRRYVSYDAINDAFETLNLEAQLTKISPEHAKMRGGVITEIALPLIGAGLAQGDWQIISRIIERQCRDVQPVVYTLDGHIPS